MSLVTQSACIIQKHYVMSISINIRCYDSTAVLVCGHVIASSINILMHLYKSRPFFFKIHAFDQPHLDEAPWHLLMCKMKTEQIPLLHIKSTII